MDYSNGIEPVTVLKSKSSELLYKVRKTGQPIIITQNGKATAVLQDIKTFQKERESLMLLKFLAQGEQELMAGKGISHSKAKEHFSAHVKKLKNG